MSDRLKIVLLAGGAILGFGSGIAHLAHGGWHRHHGWHRGSGDASAHHCRRHDREGDDETDAPAR